MVVVAPYQVFSSAYRRIRKVYTYKFVRITLWGFTLGYGYITSKKPTCLSILNDFTAHQYNFILPSVKQLEGEKRILNDPNYETIIMRQSAEIKKEPCNWNFPVVPNKLCPLNYLITLVTSLLYTPFVITISNSSLVTYSLQKIRHFLQFWPYKVYLAF